MWKYFLHWEEEKKLKYVLHLELDQPFLTSKCHLPLRITIIMFLRDITIVYGAHWSMHFYWRLMYYDLVDWFRKSSCNRFNSCLRFLWMSHSQIFWPSTSENVNSFCGLWRNPQSAGFTITTNALCQHRLFGQIIVKFVLFRLVRNRFLSSFRIHLKQRVMPWKSLWWRLEQRSKRRSLWVWNSTDLWWKNVVRISEPCVKYFHICDFFFYVQGVQHGGGGGGISCQMRNKQWKNIEHITGNWEKFEHLLHNTHKTYNIKQPIWPIHLRQACISGRNFPLHHEVSLNI